MYNPGSLLHSIVINRVALFWLIIVISGCDESPSKVIASTSVYILPVYNDIKLVSTRDTIHFPLSATTYNQIKSFNYFSQGSTSFISFYDRGSQSICIYDFDKTKRVKKIRLKKIFKDEPLKNTTVYTKSFDSILVTNGRKVYLLDSSGTVKNFIEFFEGLGTKAVYDNTTPVYFKDGLIYMGVSHNVNETSLPDIKKWRAMYEFDIDKNNRKLYYQAPFIYLNNLYGNHFLDYSYCINQKGNFVFSFPADTSIYETNLKDYHVSYFAKSRYQSEPISVIPKEALEADEGLKEYLLRDSYGPVYYDFFRQRYLRLAKRKISLEEYKAKDFKRSQSVIIFNKEFKIIGETELDNNIAFGSVLFTDDGSIYVRTNFSDEYALHFVRLEYNERNGEEINFSKN